MEKKRKRYRGIGIGGEGNLKKKGKEDGDEEGDPNRQNQKGGINQKENEEQKGHGGSSI